MQGDGNSDDSQHGDRWFIDANISNGSTTSETTAGDEASVGSWQLGELRDSLYVIYFKAVDDSNQGSATGMDSIVRILVNDSLPNPPPAFTKRTILLIDSTDTQVTKTYKYGTATDSIFDVYEGDSVVITFYASDQDSAQGEVNDIIAFGMLWSDSLRGVAKGGHRFRQPGRLQSVYRAASGTVDTLVADTASTTSGSTATSFRVRLQIPFSLATADEKADTLIVMVSDGTTIVADTMALKVRNTNRPPIWDVDTTSTPSDSALAYSAQPEVVDADSVQSLINLTANNNQADSTYFSSLVYDPDFLVGDSVGYPLTFTASGNHPGTLNATTGLNVWTPTETDTVTYAWTITATDADTIDGKATANQINHRVAPAPTISKVEPAIGSVNTEFVIYGSGFGLYDQAAEDTSRVQFYATTNGVRRNIDADIISWSKNKIVASVPSGVPVSGLDNTLSYLVPDTIVVRSAIYGGFDTYPFIVVLDSAGVENLELTSVTSTSAIIRYRSNYTGQDSVVVAAMSDTLDIHSGSFTKPVFVEYNSGLSSIESNVQVFKDETDGSDGIHVIQLEDLSPGSLYRFFIATSQGVYIADTLNNVDGPYQSKKIDLTTPANNSNLSAFRFRTLAASAGTGDLFTVTGKAYYAGGAAENATVTLRVVDAASVADTSLPITGTVQSDSTWQLQLGNLKKSDGSNFSHSEGDYMLFEFDGSEMGFEQYDTVRAASDQSPMEINSVKLLPLAAFDLELKTGLNLVGLPLKTFKGEISTAHELLDQIEGGLPSISRYITATSSQETINRSIQGNYVGSDNFDLEEQVGYFVNVSSETNVLFNGRVYSSALPVVNFAGAGMYFVTMPAMDTDLRYSWDANQVMDAVSTVSTIYKYDAQIQQYVQLVREDSVNYGGTNFDFSVGEAYIFEVTAASSWDPNGPVLLASTGRAPAASSGSAIVVKPNVNSQVEAFSTVSNISSSAATIYWATGNSSAGRLVITALGDDSNSQIKISKQANGQVSSSLVTGLKAGERYAWSVEGAGQELSGVFTASQVGIGMQPYSLYGRLVDDSGNPLKGVLVNVQVARGELESGVLSAITDENGSWVVNLGNLKVDATGDVYVWNEGDEVRIEAMGSGWSSSFGSEVGPSSPFNVASNMTTDDVDVDSDLNGNTDPVGPSLPKAFALSQNFPNPFNPSTTIRFSVPDGTQAVRAKLVVFNLRGQEVAELLNRTLEAGDYSVQWDGSDKAGRRVSSGVYFYRLTTPQFSATRKMVILK